MGSFWIRIGSNPVADVFIRERGGDPGHRDTFTREDSYVKTEGEIGIMLA